MFSCKKPDREEFIGKWESEDKAMIVLNEDGTCIVQNIDSVKFWNNHHNSTIKKPDGTGKWKFASSAMFDYCIFIELDKVHFRLDVVGTGHTGYFRPWKLFIYIGDPDDMNLYEFYKK
jgi:hypothetical protein